MWAREIAKLGHKSNILSKRMDTKRERDMDECEALWGNLQ